MSHGSSSPFEDSVTSSSRDSPRAAGPGVTAGGTTSSSAPTGDDTGDGPHPRGARRGRRLGLRARITAAFGLGALSLSAVLSVLTYGFVRGFLVEQREQAATTQTFLNARVVRDGLASRTPLPDPARILSSLETPSGTGAVFRYRGVWYANSVAVGRDTLPTRLRSLVEGGTPARQRFKLSGEPWLAVGVPIPRVQGVYFEAVTLADVDRILEVLGYSLAAAALLTTIAGAAVGRWAAARVLSPLASVSEAAAAIASGNLGIRLEAPDDRDLRLLAASFNRMVDALRARIRRDARFASDVSHELRSPLTTLSTALDVLLARRDELSDRSRAALDLLAADVGRFQRMVEDLLEISRVDAGVAELHLERVVLRELVQHAVRAAGADVAVTGSDVAVAVDKRRMERVVANLVQNAVSYGDGVAGIDVQESRDVARIVVDDNGPGVPPEERQRVFERFYRGSVSGRRGHSEGSGLGLALVAEHVGLHGGRVWIEDGDGARFVVEVPRRDAEARR